MSYVLFKRRPLVSADPDPIAVTITGTGHSTYAYATINGTKYTSATSGLEVMPGDVITLNINSKGIKTSIIIDGTTVGTISSYGVAVTYDWIVPEGITSATIALKYASYAGGITVTTS